MTLNPEADALSESVQLRARLVALTGGAEHLLAAVRTGSVRRAICDLAQQVSDADAIAIWALNAALGEWRIVHSVGLTGTFAGHALKGTTLQFCRAPCRRRSRSRPDPGTPPRRIPNRGIAVFVAVPLPVHGEREAALVLYYRTAHRVSESELQVAIALGHLAAATMGHAQSFEEERRLRNEAERQAARLAFLADSSTLFTSLDYETTLRQVARMGPGTVGLVRGRHPDQRQPATARHRAHRSSPGRTRRAVSRAVSTQPLRRCRPWTRAAYR